MSRLFGRERPIHQVLGGGRVADVLLWRNKVVSGTYLIGVMTIWFLFKVAECNLMTLFCRLTITTMLVVYIWSNGARAFNRTPPVIPKIQLEESMLYKDLCENLNFLLLRLIKIAYGNNILHICLAIIDIKLLEMIGNYVSTINLLFTVLVCMGTLPYLYEKNETRVDNLVDMMNKKVFKICKMFNQNITSKIPKWPLKSD